jgi:aryl-alcohol dehydrogenase-like predicted oxidoreductase
MMKLALGTAQFGLDYGVSNATGQVCLTEVSHILALAKKHNINTLDTAPAYGSSELVLGKTNLSKTFDLISKIPALGDDDIDITYHIDKSLEKLRLTKLDAVLFHHVEDIISSTLSSQRFAALSEQKEQGKTSKIGVSLYTPAQLEFCCANYPIDIVQLPLNCLDQRFINTNWLAELADRGIEVHCRSLFLQGLLLMEPTQLPLYFSPFKKYLLHFFDTAKQLRISPLTLALAIGHQHTSITKMVVGCCNTKQLLEIIAAYITAKEIDDDLSSLSCTDERLIMPSNWH